jgi:hypothetical protein
MKIHELIKILQSHPNPDADVMITIGNVDDDNDDVTYYDIEVWNQDEFFEDFIEIFATEEEEEPK